MARRAGVRRVGQVVPGLAGALIEHYKRLDHFHLPQGCHSCDMLAEVRAGRPIVVGAGALHGVVPHDQLGCAGDWTHDSPLSFLVTGDRWELAEQE